MAKYKIVCKYRKYYVYSEAGQLIFMTSQKSLADEYKKIEKTQEILKKAVDAKSQ
jgi:hypothetical protein